MCDEMNPILTYLEVLSQNYLVGMINYIYWPSQDEKWYASSSAVNANEIVIDEADKKELEESNL
jgi:hypothetical protein